jgi:hypothetical protein
VVSDAAVEAPTQLLNTGRDKHAHQWPALEIFYSYQQLLRIATQPTTQHPHHIDIQGIFGSKHSLRDGFTAYFALSLVNRACCHHGRCDA